MKLNPYFSLQKIGGSTVLLPFGKTGWRNHGVIQLKDEEVPIVRCLIKETTEEELVAKLAQELVKPEEELKVFVHNSLERLREYSVISE